MSFFEPNLIEPFALSLSKGRAAQILTQPQRFKHHEVCGYMLRRAQHERISFSVTPELERILKPVRPH